ncbi:hypothetical protein ACQKCH_08340 [Nubsella zeaxanthinifaciens]|uniref:hypothetical protein n=1 Tax=Nubsella zeaxanthinifaciens TaxID=392412 RepID=UPI003D039F97
MFSWTIKAEKNERNSNNNTIPLIENELAANNSIADDVLADDTLADNISVLQIKPDVGT